MLQIQYRLLTVVASLYSITAYSLQPDAVLVTANCAPARGRSLCLREVGGMRAGRAATLMMRCGLYMSGALARARAGASERAPQHMAARHYSNGACGVMRGT